MHNALVFALALPLFVACADISSMNPSCSSPAPLRGTFDPDVPYYVVEFREGVNTTQEVARLEHVYGFSAAIILLAPYPPGFEVAVAAVKDVLEMLRCEPSVANIDYLQIDYHV